MARFESILTTGTSGGTPAGTLLWEAVLSGGRWTRESRSALHASGNPGNPAGRDPIISQDVAEREFELPPSNPHVLIQRWVQTTGTVYAFAPSISALKALGSA